MKHRTKTLSALAATLLLSSSVTGQMAAPVADSITTPPPPPGIPRLLEAYPRHLKGYEANHVLWHDGTRMPYDDGRFKTEDQAFDSTDLEDHMNALVYTPGLAIDTPGYNCDPGTIRYQELFLKMYGATEADVRRSLVPINWPGKKPGTTERVWVTSINGVNKHLQAVANELMKRPHLRKYVTNIGGTWNWRPILGTNRMSAHSFGIAIDINTKYSQYWKWDYRDTWQIDSIEMNIKWRNTVPLEIVEIFERHGFIWGGKWYHYDTMHFEFRPEILKPAPLKSKAKKSPARKAAAKGTVRTRKN
jgi:peptidoglycan L-alanyl-D-glutamate endopeptidase CwlK